MSDSIRVEDNGNGTFDVLKNSRGWQYDRSIEEVMDLLRRARVREFTMVEPDGWRKKVRVTLRGRS